MSELVSIREAARRLGISIETLRKWERAGRITAERTEGGHRRFRVGDLERLQARHPKTVGERPALPSAPAPPSSTSPTPAGVRYPTGMHVEPFWDGQLKDARARVEVKRLRREAMDQQAEIDKRRALAQQEQAEHRQRYEHRERLQELKAFGRGLVPGWIGAEARAEIIGDLEQHVSPERFTLELPLAEARVVVQARVNLAITRFEARRAEEAAKAECERRREVERRQFEWLIVSGVQAARRATWLWGTVDQARALRHIEEQLREEVRANWSYTQVEALVTELLSEFEECDEDDEASDALDDEEGEDDDED